MARIGAGYFALAERGGPGGPPRGGPVVGGTRDPGTVGRRKNTHKQTTLVGGTRGTLGRRDTLLKAETRAPSADGKGDRLLF